MSENPYVPPSANLSKASSLEAGTLQSGIDGRYSLSIDEIWRHAWNAAKGAKATLLLAMLVFVGVSWALTEALALMNLDGQQYLERGDLVRGYLLTLASGIVMTPITVPLTAGIIMMAARRAAGGEIRIGEMFSYYDRVVPLVVMSVTSTILIYLGFMLCILPGLYLSIAYVLAVPALVDKNLSPWQALEASRKAIHHSWLSVFLLMMGSAVVAALASIPLITIAWSVPWLVLVYGTLYLRVLGLGSDETSPVAESPPISYP